MVLRIGSIATLRGLCREGTCKLHTVDYGIPPAENHEFLGSKPPSTHVEDMDILSSPLTCHEKQGLRDLGLYMVLL